MPLRRSPVLTPRALAARRANALKSTGPRTAAGKARSCLNALRHGRRAHDLRAKIARTGDSEALFLLDWFHERILLRWQPRNERWWRYTIRLAARVWCFMNGRSLRPRSGDEKAGTSWKRVIKFYQYGDWWRCPRRLRIGRKRGSGIQFRNPTPTRRKHVLLGWLPEFRYLPGPPPKPKRVRRVPAEQGSSVDGGALEPRFAALKAAKNEVRTNLECPEESVACYDFGDPGFEAAIERAGDGLRGCSEAEGFNSRGTEFLPGEVMFAGDEPFNSHEPFDFSDLSDDSFEVCPPAHALIKLQWAGWRQALATAFHPQEPRTPGPFEPGALSLLPDP
jgi:hypothetical protein